MTGHRYTMSRLADALAARGGLQRRLPAGGSGGGYPATEDLACAVRFARADSIRFGGKVAGSPSSATRRADTLPPSSRSPAMVTTGTARSMTAQPCPMPWSGWPVPTTPAGSGCRFPPSSGTPESAAEAWSAGNPFQLLGANPSLVVRLAWGDQDTVVPEFYGTSFQEALAAAGYDATFTVVPGPTTEASATLVPRAPGGRPGDRG